MGSSERVSPNGYVLPALLSPGQMAVDGSRRTWVVDKMIGTGGFGDIYSARAEDENDYNYVCKVEPFENGPLFVEINFYLRVCRPANVNAFCSEHRLSHLALPLFVGSGSIELDDSRRLRFLILNKLGPDLQSVLDKIHAVSHATAAQLALQLMAALEFVHEHGYVHKDLKGSNILFCRPLDINNVTETELRHEKVCLIDFGLCCRFRIHEIHKPEAKRPRWAHEGTLEYTSRDGHLGCVSRRGDVESLLYNMIEWVGGVLPWERFCDTETPHTIQAMKLKEWNNVSGFLSKCFGPVPVPRMLSVLFLTLNRVPFREPPPYDFFRQVLNHVMRLSDGDKVGRLPGAPRSSSFNTKVGPMTPEAFNRAQEREIRKICRLSLNNPTPAMVKVLEMREGSKRRVTIAKNNNLKESRIVDRQPKGDRAKTPKKKRKMTKATKSPIRARTSTPSTPASSPLLTMELRSSVRKKGVLTSLKRPRSEDIVDGGGDQPPKRRKRQVNGVNVAQPAQHGILNSLTGFLQRVSRSLWPF